jgi:hypothetical protein
VAAPGPLSLQLRKLKYILSARRNGRQGLASPACRRWRRPWQRHLRGHGKAVPLVANGAEDVSLTRSAIRRCVSCRFHCKFRTLRNLGWDLPGRSRFAPALDEYLLHPSQPDFSLSRGGLTVLEFKPTETVCDRGSSWKARAGGFLRFSNSFISRPSYTGDANSEFQRVFNALDSQVELLEGLHGPSDAKALVVADTNALTLQRGILARVSRASFMTSSCSAPLLLTSHTRKRPPQTGFVQTSLEGDQWQSPRSRLRDNVVAVRVKT